MTYDEAARILTDCAEDRCPKPKRSEVRMGGGKGTIKTCVDCWNEHVYARREARKAQLAERPKDCQRCAARPHRWIVKTYRLCGYCKTKIMREHHAGMAKTGDLAIIAGLSGAEFFDTAGWKGLR